MEYVEGLFLEKDRKTERISASRKSRRERGKWQRRFWEHLMRDETDFNRQADYILWNPVKHGWVNNVRDWPHSSFYRYIELEQHLFSFDR